MLMMKMVVVIMICIKWPRSTLVHYFVASLASPPTFFLVAFRATGSELD